MAFATTPPAFPPGSPTGSPPKLPKAGFFWALGIFVVTAAAGVVLIALAVTSIVDTVDGFERIDVPGRDEVRLEAGDNWVFAGGDSGTAADLVDVTITAPDGSTLTLTQDDFAGADTTSDGQQFSPLGFVDVPVAGTYVFETDGPPGSTVRVGTLDLARIVGFFIGGFAVGGLGFVIALTLLIVTLVRRGSAKKRQRAAAYAGAPAYPGAPPTGYPGTPPPPTA